MDTNLVILVALLILAAIAVVGLILYRRQGSAEIKGPFDMGLKVSGSNQPPPERPGVNVTDAKSRSGGLRAEDRTARGANVERVEVEGDIHASSEGTDSAPKVPPPH